MVAKAILFIYVLSSEYFNIPFPWYVTCYWRLPLGANMPSSVDSCFLDLYASNYGIKWDNICWRCLVRRWTSLLVSAVC